jgi:hypothetical protein
LAEFSSVSPESRKRKMKTVMIDFEETLQLFEAKRAEQVDQRLKLDRDRLEFEARCTRRQISRTYVQ